MSEVGDQTHEHEVREDRPFERRRLPAIGSAHGLGQGHRDGGQA